MKIFIYWNKIDNDSKKIYKFLKNDTFRQSLGKDNDVVFFEPFCSFLLTQERINQIAMSDIIIFFTHGEDDAILKSKYKQPNQKKTLVLLTSIMLHF